MNNNQSSKFFEQKIKDSTEIINTLKKEIIDKKELINFIKIFNATIIVIGLFVLINSIILTRIYWHSITFYAIFYTYLIGAIPISLTSLIISSKTKKKLKKLKKELSIENRTKESYINELNRINSLSNNNKENSITESQIYDSSDIERINNHYINQEKNNPLVKRRTPFESITNK